MYDFLPAKKHKQLQFPWCSGNHTRFTHERSWVRTSAETFFCVIFFFFLLTEDLLCARRDEVFIVLDLDIPLNLRAFWGQIHWTEWDWIWLNWFLLICDKYYLDPGALPEFFSRGERCWQQPYPPRLHLPHSTPIKLVLARLAICEYFQRTVPYFHCCPVLLFKNLFLVLYFFLKISVII